MSLETLPVHMFKRDCWQRRPLSRHVIRKHPFSFLDVDEEAASSLPGAGIGKIVPFETVQKDGFYLSECAADYMFSHGDKFGDGKFSYELESVSNVSIVHYSEVIPEEDREKMSHTVCFNFCRTVPDMLFFGIRNGYECYCAPYYKPMADDNSVCAQACEGEQTQVCGGKTKSSIFAMHMCDTLAEDVAAGKAKAEGLSADLTTIGDGLTAFSSEMQTVADELQKAFGTAGDPSASDLMQSAKVFAGELEKGGTEALAMVDLIGETTSKVDGLDLATNSFDAVHAAEGVLKEMEQYSAAAEEKVEEMQALLNKVNVTEVIPEQADQYYSVMYFVDKAHTDVPSTCSGKAVGKPIYGSLDACASACDADVHSCVGFSYFQPASPSKDYEGFGLCFLLASFKTLTYYTGCGSSGAALLQEIGGANTTQCRAKFSKFGGTSLKPDGSGKCKACFREATDAARCFQ